MPLHPHLPNLEEKALQEGSALLALEFLKKELMNDPRVGARKLLSKYQKKVLTEETEILRLDRLWAHEKELTAKGYVLIAGVDEAGRGPLAGPVVAGAVVLYPGTVLKGVDDSKKLTPEKRDALFEVIRQKAESVGLGEASAAEIDELNIFQAARLAMDRAIRNLPKPPYFLLTDAMKLPSFPHIPQRPLIHGDALSASIAAASIMAKVTRDRMMEELDRKYPGYGFLSHKGYGTAEHLQAIQEKGLCPEHRMTFGPVAEALAREASGGPLGYWTGKLEAAKNGADLKKIGLLIKRVASENMAAKDLEKLREIYAGKADRFKGDGFPGGKA